MTEPESRGAQRTATTAARAPVRDLGPLGASVLSRLRLAWPVIAAVAATLLWWPVGFLGLARWLHLPLRALDGDVVLLSATASAATVAVLVRTPWPRLAIVLGLSLLGWVLSAPVTDTAPDEREVLVIILVTAGLLGLAAGSRATGGPVRLAGVLALVAGLSQAQWPQGLLLAVALALPFWAASPHRVVPTLARVLGVLCVWLAASVLALSLRAGWDILHPGMNTGSKRGTLTLVVEACWDHLQAHWWTSAEALLRQQSPWLWVALAVAIALVAVRVLRAMGASAGQGPG